MIVVDKEQDYLVDCLAYKLFPGQGFPIPSADMDWGKLYILIDHHRLSGQLFMLGQGVATDWPASFETRLKLDCYKYSLYGKQCSAHIKVVLKAITDAGVKLIVLKGWAHIQTIYNGDYSQRPCDDIDLLVHPNDIDIVESILRRLDYVIEKESWPGYNRRYHNGTRYFIPNNETEIAGRFSVGLHWGLIHTPSYDPKQIDVDSLFANARPLDVLNIPVFQLSLEDEVVYLCGHLGLHHRFDDSLFRYYELAVLIRLAGARLNWQNVIEKSIQWRHVVPVGRVLHSIHQLWLGVVLPEILEIIDGVRAGPGERFVDIWINKTRGHPIFLHILRWFTFPRVLERPLIALQDIFPSLGYMVSRYGSAPVGLWPLLYVRRFFRAFHFSPNAHNHF